MNRKIVILTQYFYPEMGAPQTRLLELCEQLIHKGWEVVVITAMPNYPTGKIFEEYKDKFRIKENINRIQVLRFWLYASNSNKSFKRVLSMISFSITTLFSIYFLKKYQPKVLFVESPPLLLCITGFIISKWVKTKLLINISDLWPLSFKELGVLKKSSFIYKRLLGLERFVYRNSDIITGQSEEIVDYIRRIVPRKKISLFRNGVDASRFSTKQLPPNKQLKIVYAGLIGVAQGIPNICSSIDFHSLNAEFHIYGNGPELKLLNAVIKLKIKGVFYHGTLERNEIPSVLQEYDAALIPLTESIYGAVPSKIYEAMAAGLPIFFSGNGEGARIIEDNECGWINDPKDYNKLAENIAEFGSDKNKLKEIKDNCRYAAEHVFDRRIQIEELEKFILSAV